MKHRFSLTALVLASLTWLFEPIYFAVTRHLQRNGLMLGANAFSKEERVAFEDILEGFQDALVLSRNVAVYNTDQTMMERTNKIGRAHV